MRKLLMIWTVVVSISVLSFSQAIAQTTASSNGGANVSASTSNYQLLLEIRSLQREVAELRDRIDQQEFKMDRMRQQQASNSRSSSNTAFNNESATPELPKKVEQFDRGAVVEEIDLSSVPIDSAQPSLSKPQEQQAAVSQEEPFFNREPTLTAPTTPATPSQPQEVPIAGEPGGTFGAINQGQQVIEQPQAADVFGSQEIPIPVQRPNIPAFETPSNETAALPIPNEQVITQQAPQIIENQSANSQLLENGDFGIKTQLGEEELYSSGLSELKKQDYEKAISILSSQISQYPKGGRTADAYYWIGESFYILERLNAAKKSYMSILNLFPDNRRVPNAIYKVAVIEYEQGNTPAAREAINTLDSKYPTSSAAAQAKTRFGGLL